MTLPSERLNAVNKTRDLLRRLLDPKQTPGVPKAIRESAYRCLKHYPGEYDMDQAANNSPVFNSDTTVNFPYVVDYELFSKSDQAELRKAVRKTLQKSKKTVGCRKVK